MHENLARSFIANAAVEGAGIVLQFGKGHGLKPEGKPHLREFLKNVKQGKSQHPAEVVRMLAGFEYHVEDLYGLSEINLEKGALILANHSKEGPIMGYGQVAVLNYHFDALTDRHIRWTQGKGSMVADMVHHQLEQSMDTIYVDNSEVDEAGYVKDWTLWVTPGKLPRRKSIEGTLKLFRALGDGGIVGVFPEGDHNDSLIKATPLAGHVIEFAARRGIPIICISTRFSNDRFSFSLHDPLSANKIKELAALGEDGRQAIADYAMTVIASGIPEDRQGYYRDKVKKLSNVPTASV